jgi:hypothetical protein
LSIVARRRPDAGHTGITRSQLEHLIDEALGQASQEQVLTQEQAQRIIAQRLKHTVITRSQLEYLIDEALGQASHTQEQVFTREQAQRTIAQRLKDSGQATVVKSQLEDLINNQVQKDIDRVMNERARSSRWQIKLD